MNTQESVSRILERRRTRLPVVQEAIERWQHLGHEIDALGTAIDELRAHSGGSGAVPREIEGFSLSAMKSGINSSLELLYVLETRLSRGTINVGVSGRARVGKSTLLQAFSGLSDEQIPTGSGLPVTAVRSRIFHSATQSRATLSLHTFDSFRKDILAPYHEVLGLSATPLNITEFRQFQYPAEAGNLPLGHNGKHSNVTILRRLRDMQESLWSYENDLTGGERTIELSELRQYVAYPKSEEVDSLRCLRRYLAVRDVRIECSFPDAQIDHLGIIDLPGLGEVAANAQKHHLRGLQNEVDIVLLVKRPVEGSSFWTDDDANTTNLLDEARGFIRERRDYVLVLINRVHGDADLAAILRGSILRDANDGRDGNHFHVLEGDAKDRSAIHANVLTPILEHLVERLPAMDNEIIQGTRTASLAAIPRIRSALADVESALSIGGQRSASSVEDLVRRTEELRKDLAAEFTELVSALKGARNGDEDASFLAALDSAYGGVRTWIEGGFGVGKEAWQANALREMRVDKYSHHFIGDELNRIRVEISGRYCSLDNYFLGKLDEFWTCAANPLKRHLGMLLADRDGADAFDYLENCLEQAAEPCPALSQAIRDLRAIRLDYRTQLHPRVRRALDGLNLQRQNLESGKAETWITVEVSEAGVEELYRRLSQVAEQAAYMTRQALIQEAMTPALVLHAALEQFEDSLIRSGNAKVEFGRLARSCRDDIWPGIYQDLEQANARLGRVRSALSAVRKSMDQIEGEHA